MRLARSTAAALAVVLVTLAVVAVAGGQSASACSCGGITEQDAFGTADAVFTGTLVDIEELPSSNFSSVDPQRFMFDVSAVFKGHALTQQTIVTAREGASCGLEISGPGPFVVFATTEDSTVSGAKRGELYSNLCGGTRLIADGAVPTVFGAGRPPAPADVAASSDTSGSDGFNDWWLLGLTAAVAAVAATVAVAVRRRPTGTTP